MYYCCSYLRLYLDFLIADRTWSNPKNLVDCLERIANDGSLTKGSVEYVVYTEIKSKEAKAKKENPQKKWMVDGSP